MTMHINFPPEMENYIKSKVACGFYGNASEVIRDAIRRMQSEEERLIAWKAAINKGERQLSQGLGMPYTPALLEEITSKAIASLHGDASIRPDVLP